MQDHIKFASDLGAIAAYEKWSAEHPEHAKKHKGLSPNHRALLAALATGGLAGGAGMYLGGGGGQDLMNGLQAVPGHLKGLLGQLGMGGGGEGGEGGGEAALASPEGSPELPGAMAPKGAPGAGPIA